MSASNEKEQLVTQLLRATLDNKIQWVVKEPPYSISQATENYVPLYLETIYNKARIGIYEVRQKYFTDVDEYYWSESLGICIVQDNDLVVWKIEEYSPSLGELFNIASNQASGIRNILGSQI